METVRQFVNWLPVGALLLVGFGSIGALVHSIEQRRLWWFLSFFCLPGATVVYALLHRQEAPAPWKLIRIGFMAFAACVVVAILFSLLFVKH